MATQIKPDGSFEILYGQKYTGINVQMPANLIADTDAVDINNFIVRNAQITSRPVFGPWLSAPVTGHVNGYAGLGADTPGINPWANPTNIEGAPDLAYATISLNNDNSDLLVATTYGFSLPAGTIITGVGVAVTGFVTGGTSTTIDLTLIQGGVALGTTKFFIPYTSTSPTTIPYGGPTDLWGNTFIPVSTINSSTFGVDLAFNGVGTPALSIDAVQITIYYSAVILTGVGTFLSPSRFYHTFAMDDAGTLYNLDPSTNTLGVVANLPTLQSTNPVSWRVFNSTLYWVNGSQSMGAWDGQVAAGGIITYGTGAAGTGYAPGDTGHVTTGGANATYKILTVNPSTGAVYSFTITDSGSGYSVSNGQATSVTTGGGDGTFTVNVFTIGIGPSEGVATVTTVLTGDTLLGAKYIDVLDQQVILLNTVGNAADGPFTIRWSPPGLPTVFDPTVNLNAGFNIFIDFADEITGFMGLGRVGYIFHRTGITEMAPTGVGTAPFDFNHIWNSQDGIGNIFPNTIAQYGATGVFVSSENIYSVSNYQFQSIGGGARDAIFADFDAALIGAGNPLPIGTIVPGYEDDFVYLVYQLFIPLGPTGPTIMWQYSFENGTWERFTITGELVTGTPTFCLTA